MSTPVRFPRSAFDAGRIVPMQRSRFWIICLFFLLWFIAIALRLFQLQVVDSKEYKGRAGQQQQRDAEVPPRRGDLYDRNLALLATTVQVDSIYAQPALVLDKPSMAYELAQIVHTDPDDATTTAEQIATRLSNGRASVRIARAVHPDIAARITALINSKDKTEARKYSGLYLQKEFQRFYPNNQIASQVLGFVGIDDNGLGGLELKYESQLHGQPGHLNKAMDARRHVIESTQNDPKPGRSLMLTIDENIQYRAERALDAAMERTQAANGTIVIQDVHTGEILALAVRPTFNPNFFRKTTPELLRNHAVSDVYEPGSTFKLVTYAAALEQHVATPDDKVDCQGGAIKLPGGRVIHDDKGDHFGVITVHEALEHSSDVAAVKLAMRVGSESFYKYIRDFGFGSRSGVEMPGETRGLLQPASRWTLSSLGSIAMGHEVAVTPLQLVSMVSTIANGGIYLPPRVLMPAQLDAAPKPLAAAPLKLGADLPNPLPNGAHRVISTLTAAQMRRMMEGVVLYGTGKAAQLNGYSSGGKTGTAQKIDPQTHRYSSVLHVGSFAGIAPVNNPVIAVAIIIDSPKGAYYGAEVAAPVFKEVAQQVLEYLGVPHDVPVQPAKANAKAKTPARPIREDENGNDGDINALYAAVNDLPSDDPMRTQLTQSAASAVTATNTARAPQMAAAPPPPAPLPAPSQNQPQSVQMPIASTKRYQVPSLVGLSIRKAIEQAAAAGLEIEISGSGTVRQQLPAPGSLVTPGTHVVVRCGR